jgi:DNA processing protein
MMNTLSANTQAILLLTAPLIVGRSGHAAELLTPGEYKGLARHLRESQRQPSHLLGQEADEVLQGCSAVADVDRLRRLLD